MGCELIGIRSLCKDFGIDVFLHLYVDAKATLGMLARRGAGSMKHVETNTFWLQGQVNSKDLTLHKIHTDHNFADVLTKYVPGVRVERLMGDMGFIPCDLTMRRK